MKSNLIYALRKQFFQLTLETIISNKSIGYLHIYAYVY